MRKELNEIDKNDNIEVSNNLATESPKCNKLYNSSTEIRV